MVAAKTHAFGHMGIALANGLAVTIIVASSGHLGGAHVNPAVTIGFWSIGRFPARDVLPYIVVQCIGCGGTCMPFVLDTVRTPGTAYRRLTVRGYAGAHSTIDRVLIEVRP